MNARLTARLLHATRLVRGGKLIDATAAIQRALRGDTRPSTEPSSARRVVDDARCVVDVPAPVRKRGQFVRSEYTNTAGTRAYMTYLPLNPEGEALPLVVMLHGCKQSPDEFAAATRMNALADQYGFIVVYPGQADSANMSKCWNWFQTAHQQRDQGEPSLVAGITRHVLAEYAADGRRVYVAGLSAGGAMAAVMGTLYPDVYAAVGIHSGLAYAAACDVPSAFAAMRGAGPKRARHRSRSAAGARPVPTIVFHGDRDVTVHPVNGDELIARAAATADSEAEFSERERTVEHGTAGGRAYTRTVYRDASGALMTEQWLVHGAAHAWSGGAKGAFSDPSGPDASREMLRFFRTQQIIR